MKAQAALEFLLMFSFVIVIFTIAFFLYSNWVDETNQMRQHIEANRVCTKVSSTLNLLAINNGNGTFQLDLPESIYYKDYDIWIAANNRVIKINFNNGTNGVSCNLFTNNITNLTGATLFKLEKNATVNVDGGVLIVE